MKILSSKRFWLNLATVGALLLNYSGVFELPDHYVKGITFGVAVLNIVLQVYFNQDTAKKE